MTTTGSDNGWPPRHEPWPEVMTEIEVCQYLRLDEQHATPATAKRSLRFIRRTQGLASLGRLGSKVLFRKAAVDAWLAAREAQLCQESHQTCPLARNCGEAYDHDALEAVEPGCKAQKHQPSEPAAATKAATANTAR